MSRHIKKIIELKKNEYRKKTTKIVEINKHDKIVEISSKNHVRSYNSKEKKLIYTRRKAEIRSNYKNK